MKKILGILAAGFILSVKKTLKKILNRIRVIFIAIRNNLIPFPRFPKRTKFAYELFQQEELEKCYNHFKKFFKHSVFLYTGGEISSGRIREYAIKLAIKNDKNLKKTYLEFGVAGGLTINLFSKYLKKIYGFDSFEGLREDWVGHTQIAGTFDLNKKIPNVNKNVIIIVGWVQDTLEDFLIQNKPKINFVCMDMDTYETSKFILEKIKPYLTNHCIILFDQLYNYTGWDVGEYKALQEVFKEDEYKFKAFSRNDRQVVIEIVK